MKFPDFFILSSFRCGTTSLHMWMGEHPRCQRPPRQMDKEPGFFERRWGHSKEWYASLWPKVADDVLLYCSDVRYLFDPRVPARVHDMLPDLRFICPLRNPVDRAWSHYWSEHVIHNNPLWDMWAGDLAKMTRTVTADTPYMRPANVSYHKPLLLIRGMYARGLRQWFEHYPRDRFYIFKTEDLFADPKAVTNGCFRFLGLPDHDCEEYARHDWLRKSPKRPDPPAEVRQALVDFYRPYNEDLYDLIGRDMEWEK